jgi:hypothetical protein
MHGEARPVRLPQGQTAILEGQDDLRAHLILKESVRSDAYSESHVGATQTCSVFDRALNESDRSGESFPSHLVGPRDCNATHTSVTIGHF